MCRKPTVGDAAPSPPGAAEPPEPVPPLLQTCGAPVGGRVGILTPAPCPADPRPLRPGTQPASRGLPAVLDGEPRRVRPHRDLPTGSREPHMATWRLTHPPSLGLNSLTRPSTWNTLSHAHTNLSLSLTNFQSQCRLFSSGKTPARQAAPVWVPIATCSPAAPQAHVQGTSVSPTAHKQH